MEGFFENDTFYISRHSGLDPLSPIARRRIPIAKEIAGLRPQIEDSTMRNESMTA